MRRRLGHKRRYCKATQYPKPRSSVRKTGTVLYCKPMNTETFSVRLDRSAKVRLQKLAKSTGRSRAFLAAEAIVAYLDTNE